MNTEADFESRNVEDRSDWKLNSKVFQKICKRFGHPSIDLFASRTSHQLETYVSCKADPGAVAVDALQQDWDGWENPYAFLPFILIGPTIQKLARHQTDMILVTPVWPTSPWYPALLEMSSIIPIMLPSNRTLLSNAQGEAHPFLPGLKLAT